MASSFASSVYNQIRLLVTNVTKKNLKSTIADLKDITRRFGENDDAKLFVLRCLFDEIDFNDHKYGKSQKDSSKMQLLYQELNEMSSRPTFPTIINSLLQTQESNNKGIANVIEFFVKALKLPLVTLLHIGLGLAQSPHNKLAHEGT